MTTSDRFLELLHTHWGYADFRGIQRAIIDSIASGKDTLGLMPTGGGKSITFQIPALAMEGVCIVITPLIALMKDQVLHLKQKGIGCGAIYSGMTRSEIVITLENAVFGGLKLLYVSPERLHSQLFQQKLKRINVSFICVDEAHCISQWGYDFRPAYLKITEIRKLKKHVPVLALTATATPLVVDDIQQQLGFAQKNVFKMSFHRENLVYLVRPTMDKEGELLHILQRVAGSSIVYVRSRKRTSAIAKMLTDNGIEATAYHAGLETATKDERQDAWQQGKIRVMVATNAFGMGIDKPDVRTVIHIDCPDSIEAYFQEAGRAGRDGNRAYAVLLWNDADKRKLKKRVADHFPEKSYITDVYEHLAYYYQLALGSGLGHSFLFDIEKFCRIYHYFPVPVHAALIILQRAGYLEYNVEPDNQARLMFIISREDLYRLKQCTADEDKVIQALLRNYGGLFTDYGYIDEALLAHDTALSVEQVYVALKSMARKHIIHFIPKRKIPLITYTTEREEQRYINLSPKVYDERKVQFENRIDAMIAYATSEDICRTSMLLHYFGEEKSAPCGVCDVCISKKKGGDDDLTEGIHKVKEYLSDGKMHDIETLHQLPLSHEKIAAALQFLVSEEIVVMEQHKIWLR